MVELLGRKDTLPDETPDHQRLEPAEVRPPREYACWLIPSRRQAVGTFAPFLVRLE